MVNLLAEYRSNPTLKAKNELIKANIGLVKSIVSKYTGDFDDLCQIGLITLSNCIDLFDESKGAFSTYATRAIHNRLINYVTRNQSLIKSPPGKMRQIDNLDFQFSSAPELNLDKLEDILSNLTIKEKSVFFTSVRCAAAATPKESKLLKKVYMLYKNSLEESHSSNS